MSKLFKILSVIMKLERGRQHFFLIIISLFIILILDVVTLKGVSLIFSNSKEIIDNNVQYLTSMILVLVFKSFISIFTYYRLAKLSHEILESVREQLLYNFFLNKKTEKNESGWLLELIQRHSGVYSVHYIQSILRVIVDGTIVIVLSFYVVLTSPELILPAVFFVFIPMYLWLKFTKNKLKSLSEKSNFGNLKITSLVSSLLVSKDEVQINGFPLKAKEIIKNQSQLITSSQARTSAIMNGPKHIWEICFFMLAAWLILYHSAFNGSESVLQGASVGAAALLRIAPLLNSLTVAFNNVRHSRPSVEIVEKALVPVVISNFDENETSPVSEEHLATAYFSNNTTYKIKGAINKIDLNSDDVKVVLIKGASGSGKTSLVRALVGIDDAKIHHEVLLRIKSEIENASSIRWSSQEAVLIDDSIEENINLYGKIAKISEGILDLSLAKNGNVEEFVSRKIIGSANEMSTGQVRRIGLLRALYSEADWVVLDEPESGLDIERRIIVKKLLVKLSKHKKILLISHTDHFDQLAEIKIELE